MLRSKSRVSAPPFFLNPFFFAASFFLSLLQLLAKAGFLLEAVVVLSSNGLLLEPTLLASELISFPLLGRNLGVQSFPNHVSGAVLNACGTRAGGWV